MTANLGSDELQKRLKRALALAGNTYSVEDITQAVARGTMQCFVSGESFCITEVINAPRRRYLNIFMIVGELSILELHNDILAFAEEAGCEFLQAYGRPGWKPVVEKLGWKAEQIVFRRKIGQAT